ncbi:class D sortase [Virgibacillus flavescens]|uniref:class D sortase n=1 Tax=Virgibacillus flavescens TaxID=1611422 RepID=UPI003D325B4A
MHKIKGTRINRKNRLILLLFTALLVLFGLWFSSTNLAKFAKGYLIYQVNSSRDEPAVKAQPSKAEIKTESKSNLSRLYPTLPKIGDNIGELYIPKLNATLPIYHGTDEDELEKGVGHFAGSVLPGEDNNSVLSGHRDTVFRELGKVGNGDMLIVRTSAGEFKYKIRNVRIVDADDRTVIVPKPRAILTVTTCYPFQFIGPAPERYVLVAYLVS